MKLTNSNHDHSSGGIEREVSSVDSSEDIKREVSWESSEYLKDLDTGIDVSGDSLNDFSKPDWFDADKFRQGQRFFKKYLSAILFADLLSLFVLFSLQGGLEPLIFTGQLDTPFKAFKRYLSTAVRVGSWYETDIWDETSEGHKNLKTVRRMHETVRRRMTELPREDVKARGTLESGGGTSKMWTTHHEVIKKDFATACPMRVEYIRGPVRTYLSQTDMAGTQFGLMGMVLLFPTRFGIHSASKSDFEGFVHFWRTIGYLLGIEDRFNLCAGSCDVVKQKCRDVLELLALPSLRSVSREWIHMSRCTVEGIRYINRVGSFEVLVLYLCSVLDIDAPTLSATLTIWQRCKYYFMTFMLAYVIRLPGMLAFVNWLIGLSLKRAVNKSAQKLRKFEQKVYSYNTCIE